MAGITSYPYEMGYIRDMLNLQRHKNQTGSQTFIVGRRWHNPSNPLARMIDPRSYVLNHVNRVPFEMRTNK